jgi:hypothetical protein
VEAVKTIKKKPDEILRNFIKHFCNTKKAIPHIQDIKIINASRDGVTDLKTVEEIAMKKPKMVVDLLPIVNECIEASKVRAQFFDNRGKGSKKSRKTMRSILWDARIEIVQIKSSSDHSGV